TPGRRPLPGAFALMAARSNGSKRRVSRNPVGRRLAGEPIKFGFRLMLRCAMTPADLSVDRFLDRTDPCRRPRAWLGRAWVALALGLVFSLAPLCAGAFGFDDVAERARALSAAAYRAPESTLAPEIRELDYDAYRDIRFRPSRRRWRPGKLRLELWFFPPGRAYTERLGFNPFTGG